MSKRRFEMVEGGSSKFWEITEQGTAFSVRYGKIGAAGQVQEKTFADEAKAKAAAAKLIAEKTGKGYVEIDAGTDSPPATPAAPEPAPATKAAPAKASKAPKAAKQPGKVDVPELVLGDKTIGARALQNAAERLAAATDKAAWSLACEKLPGASYQSRTVLGHLITHQLFSPKHPVHVTGVVFYDLAPDVLARVLGAIPEEAVAGLGRALNDLGPVIGRLVRAEGDVGAATLPPTLARLALLARAITGATLSADDAASAMALAAEMLQYGAESVAFDDEHGRPLRVEPTQLAETFARLGGPHWIRGFAHPERLPTETAALGLKDEPFEEVVRALSMFNAGMLAARSEPPARFFEAASAVDEQKAQLLRVAGVGRAAHPDEIPARAELDIAPVHVGHGRSLARLGTTRLDAWAEHWLAQDDPHQQIRIPLERLAISSLPFGDATRDRLLAEPARHEHVDGIDLRGFVQRIRFVEKDGAEAVMRVAAAKARRREEEGASADVVRGLRLAVCAALAALGPDVEIPSEVDSLVQVSDGVDYDAKALVRGAVHRLPLARSEKAVARGASELADPFEELTYARAGASDAAMGRFARLVASGRQNDQMWLHCRSGGLAPLGAAFGPILAAALEGETLSETFFDRLATVVDAEALAHVREVAGKNVLDLGAEMKKLAAELGGETVIVYAMSVGKPGRTLSRLSRPAGYAPEDIPRAHGRKLMHAFTVDLAEVPELAARYPGARTVSLWIKAWSDFAAMPQAIVTRSEDQLAAHPLGEDAPALELTRLEVPASAFGPDPSERAQYARRLLFQRPGFLLGGPIWLQDGPWGLDPAFLAQYDERIAVGANFGDMGVAYAFEDRGTWQCH